MFPLLLVKVQIPQGRLRQGCRTPTCHVARSTKFCTVAPHICGSSIWNMLYVYILMPGILRWLINFAKFIQPCSTHTGNHFILIHICMTKIKKLLKEVKHDSHFISSVVELYKNPFHFTLQCCHISKYLKNGV